MKLQWKERFNNGGICDFRKMYDFYFKWLLSKTCACFYIKNLPETMDEFFIKSTLIVDGDLGVTDFNDKIYAVNGAPGGQPDEYYVPTQYTVANPVLGSKIFTKGVDGVVIYNADIDRYVPGGLFGLIDQTATLLADNIISINCNQINTRVSVAFTADSEAQAIAGEAILKRMYTGSPYSILRSDLVDKIKVNPIASNANAQNLTELVELNNFIIANYFQSIGIKANNIRKKSHMLQDEIDVQNDYLQISITEIMASWQSGFDKVNEIYGTDIHVELNPALIDTLIDDSDDTQSASTEEVIDNTPNDSDDSEDKPDESDDESERVMNEKLEAESVNTGVSIDKEPESFTDEIHNNEAKVEDLIDLINDKTDDDTITEEVAEDEETSDSEPVV